MNTNSKASTHCGRRLAIAIAITLALGIGGTAQAQQYAYPGSAPGSSPTARGDSREAATDEVHDRYHAPKGRNGNREAEARQAPQSQERPGNNGHGYANGTVHPIVAEPSRYGGPRQVSDGSGSQGRSQSSGYPQGSRGYGYDNGAVRPIRAQQPAPQRYRPAAANSLAPGNPSMQRGEACPPGECGHPAPQGNGGDNRGSYGYGAAQQARVAPSNVQRGTERGVHTGAGYGGVAPSIGQSRTGVGSRSSVNAGTHFGQSGATTVTGPDGKQHSYGGATTVGGLDGTPGHSRQVTGLDGKKTTVGGAGSVEGLHGTIYQNGVTYRPARDANGVNAQGDHQGGVHLNNGGMAGVSDAPSSATDGGSAGNAKGFWSSIWHAVGGGSDKSSSSSSSTRGDQFKASQQIVKKTTPQANGQDMQPGKSYPVKDPNSVTIGPKSSSKEGGGVGDDPDVGNNGGGTLVSGTGKGVDPGHRPGQDTGGGGQGTEGASTKGDGSARDNATGAYIVTNKNGQDIPVKPKVNGAFKADSNGIKGVTDPKRGGNNGGGG